MHILTLHSFLSLSWDEWASIVAILTAIVNVMGGKDFIETHYLSILAQKERFKTAFIGRQAYFWHGKENQMMELVYKYISF